LRRVVLRPDILLFTKKCFIDETGRSQGHILKSTKSVLTSTVVISPDPCLLLHQILQLWRLQKT